MERPRILICGTFSFFPDDVPGICFACQKIVYARWHSDQSLARLCTLCASKKIAKEGGEPDFVISRKCAQEVCELLAAESKKN